MVSRLWALVFLYFMRQKLNHCGRLIIVTLCVHLQSVWKVQHVPENYKIRPEIRVMCHTGPVRIIIQLSAQLSHWTPRAGFIGPLTSFGDADRHLNGHPCMHRLPIHYAFNFHEMNKTKAPPLIWLWNLTVFIVLLTCCEPVQRRDTAYVCTSYLHGTELLRSSQSPS